jgi:hypothetical protein
MRPNWMKWSVLPCALLLAASVALGQNQGQNQSSASGKPSASDPTIAQRKDDQQNRIANGVQNGSLTAGETSKLESKEAAINAETRADRSANGGKLTSSEKTQINKQQNQVSKNIYQDKHNANNAHYGNNEVGQRRENQQDRIANGVRSGQLTAGESAKLENQQRGINRQVAEDRSANGGKLTGAEKTQINHEQNQASRNIHNKKHNTATRKG